MVAVVCKLWADDIVAQELTHRMFCWPAWLLELSAGTWLFGNDFSQFIVSYNLVLK